MRFWSLAAAFLSLAIVAVSPTDDVRAQDAQGDRMKAAFDGWVARNGVQNASMAAMRARKVIAQSSAGTGAPGDREPVASLSKAITGVCIAKLVEAGRLKYAWRLGALIPDYFRAHRPADLTAKQITIGQLLNHSSGLKYDPTQGAADFVALDFTQKNMAEQLALALARPLEAKDYTYNNINFLALGMVIEAVTGQPYETYCDDTVLKPAGVTGAELYPALKILSSYGGWSISAIDYAKFLDHFRPKSGLMGSKPAGWPAWDFGNGVYYSIGTAQRPVNGRYSFAHDGAFTWNDPDRYQNFGAYFQVIEQNVRWTATYSPQPHIFAIWELDEVMLAAANPSAGAPAPATAAAPQAAANGTDRGPRIGLQSR